MKYTKAQRHEHHVKWKYGLQPGAYEQRFEAQGGRCAICGRTEATLLSVDYNHDTGAIRSLLCRGCNAALGHFGDSPAILKAAVNYLEGA